MFQSGKSELTVQSVASRILRNSDHARILLFLHRSRLLPRCRPPPLFSRRTLRTLDHHVLLGDVQRLCCIPSFFLRHVLCHARYRREFIPRTIWMEEDHVRRRSLCRSWNCWMAFLGFVGSPDDSRTALRQGNSREVCVGSIGGMGSETG